MSDHLKYKLKRELIAMSILLLMFVGVPFLTLLGMAIYYNPKHLVSFISSIF